MHELRGGQPEDMRPFKDDWDAVDFAYLMAKDPTWSGIYNDDYASLEELEAQQLERKTLDFIETPEFTDHFIGYTFYRATDSVWPSIGGVLERLLPYHFTTKLPESVRQAVMQTMRNLAQDGILEMGSRRAFFREGPNMPLDKFPDLGKVFEDQAIVFLKNSGGKAIADHIIFNFFGDTMGPYEFWAGRRKVVEMRGAGQLVREHGQICLIGHESVQSKAMHETIESIFESDNPPQETQPLTQKQLEYRMRQLGYVGTQRLVKPKQRDQGWG